MLLSQTGRSIARKTSGGRQAAKGVKDVVNPIDMDNAFEVCVWVAMRSILQIIRANLARIIYTQCVRP